MSYDPKTDQMNWQDERTWMYISLGAGLLISLLFIYFQRFPAANPLLLTVISSIAFYILSIVLRIQNHRGQLWLGRTIVRENRLKLIFPVVGLAFGISLIAFRA